MRHFIQIKYLTVLPKYSVFCQQCEIRKILATYWNSAAKLTDKNLTFLTDFYQLPNDVWRFVLTED
jgi:hypothetical protein